MKPNITKEPLKPCPFCGGEARVEAIDFDDYDYTNPSEVIWWVRCSVCGAETDEYSGVAEAEADAIKAWNTRAERTCKPIWIEDGLACDNCGYWWPLKHYDSGKPRYCPNCGARVVSEEEQGHQVADAIRRLEKAVEE